MMNASKGALQHSAVSQAFPSAGLPGELSLFSIPRLHLSSGEDGVGPSIVRERPTSARFGNCGTILLVILHTLTFLSDFVNHKNDCSSWSLCFHSSTGSSPGYSAFLTVISLVTLLPFNIRSPFLWLFFLNS